MNLFDMSIVLAILPSSARIQENYVRTYEYSKGMIPENRERKKERLTRKPEQREFEENPENELSYNGF